MCLQAIGGHIKVEIDEFEKKSRAYMFAIPTTSKKSQNVNSVTTNSNGEKT